MKMLVTDFDKTFYTKDYNENIKAANDFINKGNIFIIASGRSLEDLKKDLPKNLNYSYLFCSNGSIIIDKNNNIIYQNIIKEETSKQIEIYLKKCPYVGNPRIDYTNKNQICAIVAKLIDKNKMQKQIKQIENKYNVLAYLSENWINIHNITSNKGNALIKLCNILNYDYTKAYAVGDNTNDISLCKICNGYSVEESKKELETYTTKVKDFKTLISIIT